MTVAAKLGILIAAAYLAGSIPFGLLVGLAKGVDVRKGGSGNIGATNVARLLGKRFFFIVFTLDMLKSLLPVLGGYFILRHSGDGDVARYPATIYLLWLLIGFAAILGHMYSLFLGFKGGKGVATSAGVLLGVFPFYTCGAAIVIAIWIIIFLTTRYISVASIIGAALFPLTYLLIGLRQGWPVLGAQWPLTAFAILIAAMVVWKHRTNIARLRRHRKSVYKARGPDGSGITRLVILGGDGGGEGVWGGGGGLAWGIVEG